MADSTNNPKSEESEQPKDSKPGGGNGGPDWQRAAEDYKAQRDAAREQVAQLTEQVGALNKSMEGLKTAEDVQKAVDEALAKANADFESYKASATEREKALTVGGILAKAGCIDTGALMSHVDMSQVTLAEDGTAEGIDAEKLKESYPYLFGLRQQAGTTEVTGTGAPGGGDDIDALLDKAMKIKE